MKQKLITTLAAVALTLVGATAAVPAYLDPSKPLEERVEDALQRMTLEEKVGVLHAQSKFCSRGVQRLGIPELWTTDGPHGIRPEVLWDEWEQAAWTNDSCVAFPALTALAATWNPELAELYGRSLGEEALYRGKDVVLGPGVNIYRTPLNGRNFEYMGEDPLLASRMVVPYIKGLQSNGVAACVKHYALNNNEVNRHTSNVIVDDRTLYEIYLPAFKAAVTEGGAWSIMGSYNLYQNQHGCHNKRLLCDILRDEWGFDGVVISDWGGTHDTAEAVENGLDLEFGSWTNGLTNGRSNAYDNYYLADPYLKMLREGKADMATLDNKVRNVLRLIFRTAMKNDKGFGSLCSDEHYAAARRIGAEGIVLLRNKGNLLPLDPSKPQNILVVGENAVKMMTVGGGSSSLKVQRETSPLDGLRAQAPAGSTVVWERGYVGDPTGEYNGVTSGQDLSESRSADRLIADAADAARRADVVIFVGGLNKATGQDCEDSDRESLALPYNQDAVIEALVAANPRTVVVNVSGNAVAMPWADKVPAILQAWFLGSESGNSLADVIFGHVNPSGKLPMTFPVRLDDVAAHAVGEYPGTKRADSDIVDIRYNEGVLVGYRWFDTKKIRPLFAFGHGLSYTTFGYGKLSADASKIGPDGAMTLSVDVTNTGSRAGAETVQLYISDTKASVKRPAKELKNFAKIYLEPGQTKTVTFTVRPSDLAFFDAGAHAWKAEPGEFRAHVGAASDDIRSSLRFVLAD